MMQSVAKAPRNPAFRRRRLATPPAHPSRTAGSLHTDVILMRALRLLPHLTVLIVLLMAGSLLATAPAEAQSLLRQGSRGPAVTQLQTRLAQLRYDVGAVDGVYGTSTKHAVVAFQKVNGLARDGVVGPATRAALAKPKALAVRRVRRGTYIEVNQRLQVVALVNDGKIRRIYDTSTGKASTPTPAGRYHIERRIDGWRTSKLGTMWRPAYFHRGYALHGYPSVPPYPASHGCVRLTNASMNRLWPNLRIGTPVEIYR